MGGGGGWPKDKRSRQKPGTPYPPCVHVYHEWSLTKFDNEKQFAWGPISKMNKEQNSQTVFQIYDVV